MNRDLTTAPQALPGRFAMLGHDDTHELLRSAQVPLILGHAYSEERATVCNLHALSGIRVSVPDYAATLQAFARDPGAPVAWVTPRMSHISIPDVTPSPLRINVAGGALPSAGGAWRADVRPDLTWGVLRVNNRTWDVGAITDAAGHPVPRGLFHYQAVPFGTGTSIQVRAPVAPGTYRVRLYFGEPYGERRMDVEVEGVIRATGISGWAGAINRAKVIELPAPVAIDGQLDLVLRRTGSTGSGPMLAGVELVPASS